MEKRNKLLKNLLGHSFFKYVIVGGIATIIDWGVFYFLALVGGFYYQLSLIISFACGGLTNYTLNKAFTFKCRSKMIIRQLVVFFIVSVLSLLLSMAIMFVLVDFVSIQKMNSRILTTGIMLIINYSLHRFIIFNKRIFK